MSLVFDAERLEKALRDFYFATGAPVDLLKPDFNSVCVPLYGGRKFCDAIRDTREGRQRCEADNERIARACAKTGEACVEICHAGVVHLTVPVISGKEVVAYLAIGRFKTKKHFPLDENPIADLPLPPTEMAEAYEDLPECEGERLDSVISLAKMLASYLVTEKIIKTVNNDNLERVEKYIDGHLSENLSIEQISKATNISKSVLYRNFSAHLGVTVSDYISLKRVEASLGLLMKTDMSIEEIAHSVGFSSAAYYASIFKKCKGMTPLQFRKEKYLIVSKRWQEKAELLNSDKNAQKRKDL